MSAALDTVSGTGDAARAPVITVVRGRPTQDELAAVLPVLVAAWSAAGPAGASTVAARGVAAWTDRARAWHVLPRPGPSAWRASALPR